MQPKEGTASNNQSIGGLYLCCLCSVLAGLNSNYLAFNTPPELTNLLQAGSR